MLALQSESPTSQIVRNQAFHLSIRLGLKSLVNDHVVRPVFTLLDTITLILVVVLDTLTILEVDLRNVIGIVFELHGTTVAVDTLRNTDVHDVTIATHLADGITLCLRNVDLLVVAAVVILLLGLLIGNYGSPVSVLVEYQ